MRKLVSGGGWCIPLVCFIVHQLLQKVLEVNMQWLDWYLDPFCLGAISLYGLQLERQYFYQQLKLGSADILMTTLFLIVVSEVVFPYLSNQFVQDWRDAVSICLGTAWFVIVK
ncbi:MAG: hypothetical protein AAFX87_05975 [Bacteroidota bacterium]